MQLAITAARAAAAAGTAEAQKRAKEHNSAQDLADRRVAKHPLMALALDSLPLRRTIKRSLRPVLNSNCCSPLLHSTFNSI